MSVECGNHYDSFLGPSPIFQEEAEKTILHGMTIVGIPKLRQSELAE